MKPIAQGRGRVDAEEGVQSYPASDLACRGIALPPAECRDLKTIVDGYPGGAVNQCAI